MNIIIFYEKPGCATNKQQKKLLRDSGYRIIERDLLQHGMRSDELNSFFEHRAVKDCFNPNAPQIKTGQIDPGKLGKEEALNLLFLEPILIKRPLMIINNHRICGFDKEEVGMLLNGLILDDASQRCSGHQDACIPDKRSVS